MRRDVWKLIVEFFVPGIASPGGSKKAFQNPKTGRIVVVDDAKGNKAWRDRVASAGSEAMGGRQPFRGALRITLEFFEPRPKGHYGSGRNAGRLLPSAPKYPTKKPDALKLARAAEDALKGIVYVDDAQTVDLEVRKRFADDVNPGMAVFARPLEKGENEG